MTEDKLKKTQSRVIGKGRKPEISLGTVKDDLDNEVFDNAQP